jgi:ribonuclease D
VQTRDDLRVVCDRVARCAIVALDTESNSMHAHRERTCIVQLTVDDRHAIVDVLAVEDLSPLRDALDRRDVEVVLHGGDYDVTVLTRDHDFRFRRVFDTMIAATLLGRERVGLADLVRDHFGHELDKRFQRADWARRPLSDAAMDYLQRDTAYLPALRAQLAGELEAADLVEEATIEFERLAARRGEPLAFDPRGWQRIKGASRLDAPGRAILEALYLWREGEAKRADLPPFKVLAPAAMLALAGHPRRDARSPQDLPVLGERDRRRHGRSVWQAVRAGLDAAARGAAPAVDRAPRPDPEESRRMREARARTDRLRAWRRAEAARRAVPTVVVLPNPALAWLVEHVPGELSQLDACRDLGSKRLRRYGEHILALLERRGPEEAGR